MLHLKYCFSHLIFSEVGNEDIIFLRGNLWNIKNLILHQGDLRLFSGPKKIFVIISNVAFEVVNTNNYTMVIFKSINMFLWCLPLATR
jgi:hypothetical protein